MSVPGKASASTGQALSIQPPYFSGIACPVQAVAPALSGTVTHAQLLVDGVVVKDVVNTGQAGVTLSTTFDALSFADGYVLPIRLKVWDSSGGFYDATLSAPVRGPKLALADLWTPDYTATPPAQAALTSGTLGGTTTLHLRLQNFASATLTEVRLHLHADPDASKDTVWPNPTLSADPAQASALCGDLAPGLPPALYLNLPWNVGGATECMM